MIHDSSVIDFQEIDIDELASQIFTHHPRSKQSVRIDFDVHNVEQLFIRLMELFHTGSKILFCDENGSVNLMRLSEEDITHFSECMESFGIRLYIKRCRVIDIHRLHEDITGMPMYNFTELYDLYTAEDATYSFDIPNAYDIVSYKDQCSNRLSDWRYSITLHGKYYVVVYFDFL